MSSNKKKFKMERLSPIPVMNQDRLPSTALSTPESPALQTSHQQRRDTYAIESTSSPECSTKPRSSSHLKHRRSRASGKASTKTTTPLSGLITMSSAAVKSNKGLIFSTASTSSTKDVPLPANKPLESIAEDPPFIDDSSPQKPPYSSRHAEIISASKVFPLKTQASSSTVTPLRGLINKQTSNMNRSLNDSISILREAEDLSDDEGISNASLSILPKSDICQVNIESFESPRKDNVLSKERSTGVIKDFRQNVKRTRDIANRSSLMIEKTGNSGVEMSGHERKNRKRALDFNTSSFIVPIAPGDDCQSPVLSLKPLSRSDDRGSNEPISSLLLDSEGRLSPVLSLKPLSRSDDLGSNKPMSSPLLHSEGRLSPVLTVNPPRLETDDQRLQVHQPTSSSLLEDDEDRLSPVLDLKRPCRKAEDRGLLSSELMEDCGGRLSPVLKLEPYCLRTSNQELKIPESVSSLPKGSQYCLSPVLNLKPSHREVEGPHALKHILPPIETDCQSPVLEIMSSVGIKSNSPIDESLSDTESVIESTPKQSRNRTLDLGGFTASSSLRIENYSPSHTNIKIEDSDSEIPKIEDFPEEAAENKNDNKCDLKLVVVSHDDSSNESTDPAGLAAMDSHDVIYPSIDDRHSPNLEMNYSVKPIRSFESPSKPFKPFSEEVNIDAFGSPDSNASVGRESEQDAPSDEVIEGSTTQEYVEESEQVRPTKRRKKGSLLERVKGVIAKGCASNALFDYEIKCGLRPNRGKSVSAPLVVVNIAGEPPSFLVCKPVKHCKTQHIERISSFVIVHVVKVPSGTCEGSVVLLHFPLNIMYHSELLVPYVLAGNQIVLHPSEPQIDVNTIDTSHLKLLDDLSYEYQTPIMSFRAFPSSVTRSLSQAALCQNLVEESNLYLTVLHLTRFHELGVLQKITVLCCDEESQYCWMSFTSEEDLKRAAALETLGVLSDCAHVQTKGFSVVDRAHLDKKTKNLISYCSNDVASTQIIFSVCPDESNWVISSSEGRELAGKTPALIQDVLIRKKFGSRYLLEVHGIDRESEIKLKDSLGQTIQYVEGRNASITLDRPFPFFLDGVYFYDGKLFSDEHTRVIARN